MEGAGGNCGGEGGGTVDWVGVTASAGKGAITGCRQEDYRSTGFRYRLKVNKLILSS